MDHVSPLLLIGRSLTEVDGLGKEVKYKLIGFKPDER
jgi:hypothetical protein